MADLTPCRGLDCVGKFSSPMTSFCVKILDLVGISRPACCNNIKEAIHTKLPPILHGFNHAPQLKVSLVFNLVFPANQQVSCRGQRYPHDGGNPRRVLQCHIYLGQLQTMHSKLHV
jgi:hypothetical protein